jgi:hypothetical protein
MVKKDKDLSGKIDKAPDPTWEENIDQLQPRTGTDPATEAQTKQNAGHQSGTNSQSSSNDKPREQI